MKIIIVVSHGSYLYAVVTYINNKIIDAKFPTSYDEAMSVVEEIRNKYQDIANELQVSCDVEEKTFVSHEIPSDFWGNRSHNDWNVGDITRALNEGLL